MSAPNPFTRARLAREAKEARDQLGNRTAREGWSRCECGCKYWENDRCIDCNTQHDPARHDKEE